MTDLQKQLLQSLITWLDDYSENPPKRENVEWVSFQVAFWVLELDRVPQPNQEKLSQIRKLLGELSGLPTAEAVKVAEDAR